MDRDRLGQIQAVCEQALARIPRERAVFIEHACAGDVELRDEVVSLLAQHAEARSFLERPALAGLANSLPAGPEARLAPGTTLGPYEVLHAIGAGGMGLVYKARDTRLGRCVAIKMLAHELNASSDWRTRFEQEARTIAALTHPHICTLHDVGEYAGAPFLVMEYLDGDTLAERLRRGALPVAKSLELAAQIADALSAAHRQGIVHRDLKPANVMLTTSGAKLLDFGLAKMKDGIGRVEPLTAKGTILGTVQYMAPEQLEGRPSDARADIWALGLILYEMLTGRPAFEGEERASLIAAILRSAPTPPSAIQPMTPAIVDDLVCRCLMKAPDDRPDTAHDVQHDLLWMRQALQSDVPPATMRTRIVRVAALLTLATAATLSGWYLTHWLNPVASRAVVVRSELSVSPAEELNGGGADRSGFGPTAGGARTSLAWSADGRSLLFVGRERGAQRLYVRSLDAMVARPLAGTEGAQVPTVSPDGKWLAFWAHGTLKKLPLDEGGPIIDVLSGLPVPPLGLVLASDGRLFFGMNSDGCVWQVAAGSGASRLINLGEAERGQVVSSMLPGDRHLVYTSRSRVWTWGDEQVVVLDLASGRKKVLLHDAADARYVRTGHLLFLRRGTLWGVPFDLEKLEIEGTEIPLWEGVAQALHAGNSADVSGAGQFAVAANGSVAWIPGDPTARVHWKLIAFDRQGHSSPVPVPEREYAPMVRVSPDGQRLALVTSSTTASGLWVYDLARGTLRPLRQGGEISWPGWSADERRIMFEWLERGKFSVRSEDADEAGHSAVLAAGPFVPSTWTTSGDVIGTDFPGGTLLRAGRDKNTGVVAPEQMIAIGRPEAPAISPDGRWLAYASYTGTESEVYVQPYPGAGSPIVVSVDGGYSPAWNHSGRELFYISVQQQPADSGKRRMMSVTFDPGPPGRLGTPRSLFEFDAQEFGFLCTPVRCFDVSPDSRVFYVFQKASPPAPLVTSVKLVQNWFEELTLKVPRRK